MPRTGWPASTPAERYRRGKTYRARAGSVNVLGGAPFGYRYRRKTPEHGATYQIIEDEAAIVAELFRRYTDDGASIADLARWLTGSGALTRTGKTRWDRSVVWGMLRNPAYAGTAVFGKTQLVHEAAGLNRRARLQGRTTPRAVRAVDRPRTEWITIPVPAISRRSSAAPRSSVPRSGLRTTSGSPPATARSPRCSRAWPPAPAAATATTTT